jgi:hypothetical protein
MHETTLQWFSFKDSGQLPKLSGGGSAGVLKPLTMVFESSNQIPQGITSLWNDIKILIFQIIYRNYPKPFMAWIRRKYQEDRLHVLEKNQRYHATVPVKLQCHKIFNFIFFHEKTPILFLCFLAQNLFKFGFKFAETTYENLTALHPAESWLLQSLTR